MSARKNSTHSLLIGVNATWAFAESLFFFIMPDFLLLASVIGRPQLASKLLMSAVVGSAFGTLILALFVMLHPVQAYSLVSHVPFVTERMFDKSGDLISQGSVHILLQPISGIPIKVWTYTSIEMGYSFGLFFVLVMAARIVRMSIVCGIGLLLNKLFAKRLARYKVVIIVLYAAGFILVLWRTSL